MKERDEKEVLEERIGEWRTFVRRRRAIESVDVDELEDHLRGEIAALEESGLDQDEAFLVAVKRMGGLDALSREFAREHSERLWKQLVVPRDGGDSSSTRREAVVAVGLAIAAAVAIKIPSLFGIEIGEGAFHALNFSFFTLPFLAAYFAWKRDLESVSGVWLALPFVAAAAVVNLLPYEEGGHTQALTALHLPIALWLGVGIAYCGGRWRDHRRRMDFVRFSGEWLIYFALIGMGGGVLMAFTMFVFDAIGLDAEWLLESWILPCGVVGAVVIAGWLVEAKQSVIENMAPVLTRLFAPLFAVLLLVFLGTILWTGSGIDVQREVLIGFDLLLVVVLGLLLYWISARDHRRPAGPFDLLQLVLVVSALAVDAVALWAISARISEFGFSPNKVAALGENLVLLVNLGWSALLYGRFVAKRGPFAALERWQTAYLPVYGAWAVVVALVFPVLFGYR